MVEKVLETLPMISNDMEYDMVSGMQVLAREIMNWSFIPGYVGLMEYKARSLDVPRKMGTNTRRESYSAQRVVKVIDFGRRLQRLRQLPHASLRV